MFLENIFQTVSYILGGHIGLEIGKYPIEVEGWITFGPVQIWQNSLRIVKFTQI